MRFEPTSLPDVIIVEAEPRIDERGFLARTFCDREFAEQGLNTRWVQHNHTRTLGLGSVRGLHFQSAPHEETKLVRCVVGRVYDVAVDVRPASSTFGKWVGVELSAENHRALYIPGGHAHGFQCLTEECELHYLMSEHYRPDLSAGIRWDDPAIGISWPCPVNRISPRDEALPFLSRSGSAPGSLFETACGLTPKS